MKEKTEGVRKIWDRYKYAALVALIGAGLLLWPGLGSGEAAPRPERKEPQSAKGGWDLQTVQTEMENILAAMDGVGQVKVMLTVESDGERQLAQDTELSYSGDTAAPEEGRVFIAACLADQVCGLPIPDAVGLEDAEEPEWARS